MIVYIPRFSKVYSAAGPIQESAYRAMFAAGVSENAAGNGTESLEERLKQAVLRRKKLSGCHLYHGAHEPPAWISLDARYISERSGQVVYLCICADVTYIKGKRTGIVGL